MTNKYDERTYNSMPRYMIIVQYDGTKFSGWQAQKNAKTIGGTLNRVLSDLIGCDVTVYGSGRTDAGVHAIGQTAHFDVQEVIDTISLLEQTNRVLPDSITIKNLQLAENRFHARHHAVSRTYIYQLSNKKQPFLKNYLWVPDSFDFPEKLKEVIPMFKGFYDFVSFSAEKDKDVSTEVHMLESDVCFYQNVVLLRFIGSHFLRSMVRRLVGTAVAYTNGVFTKEDIKRFLREPCTEPSRYTAPAAGLFLESVSYDHNYRTPENIVLPIISSLK